MDESSLSRFTTEDSISINKKEESFYKCASSEKNFPIYISKDLKKRIIKSIAQNLKAIMKENIQNNQMQFIIKSDIFYLNYFPRISIEDYINRIYKCSKMNISTLIISIIYIDRFCEENSYVLSLNNFHRIFLTACLLSIKFNEDNNLNTQYYANIAGVHVHDLNNLECYLFIKLKFSLFVEYDSYKKYFEYFCKNLN